MLTFTEWLVKEIGLQPTPDKPETIPITAIPTYTTDGEDRPPTPKTNARRLRMVQKGKIVK